MAQPRRRSHGLLLHFERTIGAGLLVALPIGVTALILKFFFDLLDPLLQDTVLQYLPGPESPGLGVVGLVVLVYAAGLITTHVLGRRLIDLGHRIMEFIPVVKSIYGTARAAVKMFTDTRDRPYSAVVLVEFPRVGMKSIGLVTANLGVIDGEEKLAVYVPTTPIPSSGFLVIVPAKDITRTEMSVDEAMRIIVSGGILSGGAFVPPAKQEGPLTPQEQVVTGEVDQPASPTRTS